MNIHPTELRLEIQGLGIVFYSPPATDHITEHEDYLGEAFSSPRKVAAHANSGGLVAFETATPGRFRLTFNTVLPPIETLHQFEYTLQLPLIVQQGTVYFRDLYDLMDWTKDCPTSQKILIDDGYYLVTLCSNTPETGVLGDDQTIDLHFQQMDELPQLQITGIPSLCF